MEHLDTKIHNYKLTRFIGEGGMASVYEGTHEKLGTKVAIKIINPILSTNKELRQRFENEARFMAQLEHPNIVKVLDYEEQPQMLAIIMELLQGQDMGDFIKKNGALKPEEVWLFFSKILDAFDYAHKEGVVHRDVKPDNIFIEKGNSIKILDFGIAKLIGQDAKFTSTGTQMGTPVYMSPEQVKADKSIDHLSDIYSIGVTLYFALSGKPPYDHTTESNFDIYNKIVYEKIPELNVYTEFNNIIQKATAKARNERYQTAAEFKNDLFAVIDKNKTIINKQDNTIINSGKTQITDKEKTHITNKEKTVITKKQTPKPPINTDEEPTNKKPNRNLIIAIISAIAVIAIIIFFVIKSNQPKGLTAEEQQRIADSTAKADSLKKADSIAKISPEAKTPEQTPQQQTQPPAQQSTTYTFDYQTVYVSGGAFTMGCTSEQGSDCDDDEKPAHNVTVSSYYMGKYEVTQKQWREIMGNNPSKFSGCDNCPVEQVSWNDIQDFISKLNAKTGKTYRLPSEAQWEFAARGGNKSNGYKYSGSDNISSVAWYDGNSNSKTHAVGQKSPNELGIYDMSGNVWEWCSDWKKGYPGSSGVADYKGSYRVDRGGSWFHNARFSRVSFRSNYTPGDRDDAVGFRLVLVP